MQTLKKPKVYIDGQAGTTGLQIVERLKSRNDIELLLLDDSLRHDEKARKAIMKEADLVFLCLPDAAAIEAAEICDPSTRIIDASTAHRTSWTYGFPELSDEHFQAIQSSARVANPGCHASGMIALIYPLIESGLLKKDASLSVFSLTGYSGGGKKMIEEYETDHLVAPRSYALSLNHKHIPEMMKVAGLQTKPMFLPVIDNFRQGMETSIMIDSSMLNKPADPDAVRKLYHDFYDNSALIEVMDETPARLAADLKTGRDSMEIHVGGNHEQILLQAVFDNLGKGASGAAIENMNIMLGFAPETGLIL